MLIYNIGNTEVDFCFQFLMTYSWCSHDWSQIGQYHCQKATSILLVIFQKGCKAPNPQTLAVFCFKTSPYVNN